MNLFKMSFRKKMDLSHYKLSTYPDAKSPDWNDAEHCWYLNQEIARRLFFFDEWAGYDWETDYYDAG